MNPIIKNHLPTEMKITWEGQGLPVWKQSNGDVNVMFFASDRDLTNYSEKDEFYSLVILDGKGAICLLPPTEKLKAKKPLINLLERNQKVKFIPLPPLLSDFLFSSSGEIMGEIPGELQEYLKIFKEDKEDILLGRKASIYAEALSYVIKTSPIAPKIFCRDDAQINKDAQQTWGSSYIGDRETAVAGMALAFVDLTSQQKELLAGLREVFKGGREGAGVGDLHGFLPSKGGYSTIPDDILPRYGRKKELKDAEPIQRLKIYWRDEEVKELTDLCRILSLENFLQLHQDEDKKRILAALWRAKRNEFDYNEFDNLVNRVENAIVPVLRQCTSLEKEYAKHLGLSGIDFEQYENLVKSSIGFEKLLSISKQIASDSHPLLKCLMKILLEPLEIEKDARELEVKCQNTKKALDELVKAREDLEKNYWQYRKATKFAGLKKEELETLVAEQMKINGEYTLEELRNEVIGKKEYMETISSKLAALETRLNQLDEIFVEIKQIQGKK